MDIHCITFQSILHPEKLSMYSGVADSYENAKRKGLAALILKMGDLQWEVVIHQTIKLDLKSLAKKVKDKIPQAEIDISENWLLGKIIDNKDTELFKASEKYLPEHSILLIKDKLKCKK